MRFWVFRVEVIKWPPLVFPVTLATDSPGLAQRKKNAQMAQIAAQRKKLYASLSPQQVAESVQAVQAIAQQEASLKEKKKRPLQLGGHPPKREKKMSKVDLKAKPLPPLKGSVSAAPKGHSGAGLGLKIVFSIVYIL